MIQVAAPFAAATSGGFTFSPSTTPGAQGYNNHHNNNTTNLQTYDTPPPQGQQPKQQPSISHHHHHQQQSQPSQPFPSHVSAQGFAQPHSTLSPQIYGSDASMMSGGSSISPQHQQPDATQLYQTSQQQFTGQQPFIPYTTAGPYQASTPIGQTTIAQNLRQSHSASPHHSISPSAAGAPAHQLPPQPPQQQPTPPGKFPMAAPPLPHTPANLPPSGGAQAVQSPQTPQSPATQSRESQRITLLLDINVELLQEVNRLQREGKGGALSPQQQAQLKNQGLPDTIASDEYIQCLRRVQANLSYMGNMAPSAQRDIPKILPGPALMTPPPHMSQLVTRYEQLRDLFPGWPGNIQKSAQATSNSPNPNAMNAGSPTT